MSRDSATPNLEEEADEHGTAVASTSLEDFRSTVAGFRFSPEPPTLRRSARSSRQAVLCEEEKRPVKSKVPKSAQSSKRKNGEAETVKKEKFKRSYAEPERYAHLNGLPDIIGDKLDGNS